MRVHEHKYPNLTVVRLGEEHVDNFVACYRQVYGEATAWNEFKKCLGCGQKWSIQEWAQHLHLRQSSGKYVDSCHICGNGEIVDYWPKEVVRNDVLTDVVQHPKGLGVVMLDANKLIGFSTGYGCTIADLEKHKSIPNLSEVFRVNYPNDSDEIFYQAELGLLEPYRGKGLGKVLLWHKLNLAINAGHNVGILRTNPRAVSASLEYKYGYREIPGYTIPSASDGLDRIIMRGDLNTARDSFIKQEPTIVRMYPNEIGQLIAPASIHPII